jgi:hypothetical protein
LPAKKDPLRQSQGPEINIKQKLKRGKGAPALDEDAFLQDLENDMNT